MISPAGMPSMGTADATGPASAASAAGVKAPRCVKKKRRFCAQAAAAALPPTWPPPQHSRPSCHHLPHHRHHSAWVLATRAALAVAFAGWVAIVAGFANHQERLNNTAFVVEVGGASGAGGGGPGAGGPGGAGLALLRDQPGVLLDRISSWALLHDAEYFARYQASLDPGRGFNKFWWLAAVEAAGLGVGLAATFFPASHARTLASALLAMSQAPDLPEMAVETVSNYRALGVPLPAYRVAIVVGASIVPFANLVAAMILGWNPASPGPDLTAVPVPPPSQRGCSRLQARLERLFLGVMDVVHKPAQAGMVAAATLFNLVGWVGFALGVASGKWWRTHLPLCGLTLAAQVVANASIALSLRPWTQGRANGTADAAAGAALVLSIWRINRSWAGGVTLVAVRAGAVPPPGYVLFNAGTIAWFLMVLPCTTLVGTRAPQPEDVSLRAWPYRAVGLYLLAPIQLAGMLLCIASTLISNTQEEERRMWAGELAFSQSGDRWWLMYMVTLFYVMPFKPFIELIPLCVLFVLLTEREDRHGWCGS